MGIARLNTTFRFYILSTKNKVTIATCRELQDELIDVLLRPKFKKYFSETYIKQLIQFYKLTTKPFEINEIIKVVTDEKDNYLFALCETAAANFFITGDKLLLKVKSYKNTFVISLAEFKVMQGK
ncbi:putative toxin-antitoxin system toxin component, PIN family [Mucilaginibacter sp. FT3.2]|uniref:putative toxin-antitoxin system toxin component, PIN family n=1 Tax=Mucilaginibacter sp. FT3.2 TaxID=2723090 RepID=UPI001611E3C0